MPANEQHWRALERLYRSAPTNEYFRPAIRIGEGVATITLDVRSDFFHAAGAVHGAVLFKLLDDAAYFAVNSLVTDGLVLTTEFSLHFFRPVSTGSLVATGSVQSPSRRLAVASAELRSGTGVLLAQGSGSYIRSAIPLGPDVGYVMDGG